MTAQQSYEQRMKNREGRSKRFNTDGHQKTKCYFSLHAWDTTGEMRRCPLLKKSTYKIGKKQGSKDGQLVLGRE